MNTQKFSFFMILLALLTVEGWGQTSTATSYFYATGGANQIYTYNASSSAPVAVEVYTLGAGGGGQGGNSYLGDIAWSYRFCGTGGGGSGGGAAYMQFVATEQADLRINVGAGGSYGSANNSTTNEGKSGGNGGNGGNTTVTWIQKNSTLTVSGGIGGGQRGGNLGGNGGWSSLDNYDGIVSSLGADGGWGHDGIENGQRDGKGGDAATLNISAGFGGATGGYSYNFGGSCEGYSVYGASPGSSFSSTYGVGGRGAYNGANNGGSGTAGLVRIVVTRLHTITFNSNGGSAVNSITNIMNNSTKTVEGTTVAPPTTNPARVGYVFDGWWTAQTGESKWDFNTTITENITLYARWMLTQSLLTEIPEQEYTEQAITPAIILTDGETTLVQETDYEVEYKNNINVGTATVTVTGKGKYTGTLTAYFTIIPSTSLTPPLPKSEPIEATFGENGYIGSVGGLPDGCSWKYPVLPINTAGGQAFLAECANPNYIKTVSGPFIVNVAKAQGYGTASINDWTYGETGRTPSINNPNSAGLIYEYKGIDGTDYQSGTIPSNAGRYTMTVTFLATTNYLEHIAEPDSFTIHKAKGKCYVRTDNYQPGTPSIPECDAGENDFNSVDILYTGLTIAYPESKVAPPNVGKYEIKAIFAPTDNYDTCIATNEFFVHNGGILPPIAINPTYDGTSQSGFNLDTLASHAEHYELTGETSAINAGEYTAIATLKDGYAWGDGSKDPEVIPWEIKKKASVFISPPGTYSATYADTTVLNDIDLPVKYKWKEPNFSLKAGDTSFTAYYTESEHNHLPDSGYVKVSVKKAEGTFVGTATIEVPYVPNLYLFLVPPPDDRYEWVHKTTPLDTIGTNSYAAIYTDPSGNYEPAKDSIKVNVVMGDGKGTVSIAGWTYGKAAQTPTIKTTTHIDDTPAFRYTGTANDYTNYDSIAPPEKAGSYKITASFPANGYYNSFDTTATFTIERAQTDKCLVEMKDFVAGTTPPNPVPSADYNDPNQVTYSYAGNGYPKSDAMPSNAGNYTVTATFEKAANYAQCVATDAFTIHPDIKISVEWSHSCDENTIFTYNGQEQYPAITTTGYALEVANKQTNAGSYVAIAQLKDSVMGVSLLNATANCPYTISPKELKVTWTGEREFTYNKMNQSPTPSINKSELHDPLDFIFGGYGYAADDYTGSKAAYYIINPEDPNVDNYRLDSNRAEFKINKKDLTPKFQTTLPDFAYKNDTLRVPTEVFQDTAALQQILDSIVAYEGFATDTVKKETDDAKVLKGKAEVKIDYDVDRGVSHTPRYALAKRVETTQKATATIITDAVSADNYKPLDRSITIVEMADNEGGYTTFCKREDGRCIALNAEICEFIYGKIVPTCGEVPIAHTQNPIPYTPVTPHYYTLKGTFLGTQKPTAPGIYIAKIGNQILRIAVR